jgi:hypothetical protein
MFITTPEFLPQHRDQRQQIIQIITAAEVGGQSRPTEMNQQVLASRSAAAFMSSGCAGLQPRYSARSRCFGGDHRQGREDHAAGVLLHLGSQDHPAIERAVPEPGTACPVPPAPPRCCRRPGGDSPSGRSPSLPLRFSAGAQLRARLLDQLGEPPEGGFRPVERSGAEMGDESCLRPACGTWPPRRSPGRWSSRRPVPAQPAQTAPRRSGKPVRIDSRALLVRALLADPGQNHRPKMVRFVQVG